MVLFDAETIMDIKNISEIGEYVEYFTSEKYPYVLPHFMQIEDFSNKNVVDEATENVGKVIFESVKGLQNTMKGDYVFRFIDLCDKERYVKEISDRGKYKWKMYDHMRNDETGEIEIVEKSFDSGVGNSWSWDLFKIREMCELGNLCGVITDLICQEGEVPDTYLLVGSVKDPNTIDIENSILHNLGFDALEAEVYLKSDNKIYLRNVCDYNMVNCLDIEKEIWI
jgi:hypothetical protein